MFDLLVSNYKKNFYNKRNRKLKTVEILMIVLLIASGGISLLSLILKQKIVETVSLIFLLVILLVIIIYTDIREKKLLESDVEIKKQRLCSFKNLLNDKYGLYSIPGLKLIIRNCNNETKKIRKLFRSFSLKNYVTTIIYPVVLTSLGAVVAKISFDETLKLSAIILYCIFLFTYIWIVCISMFKLIFSRANLYDSLKADTEVLLVEFEVQKHAKSE